MRNLVRLIDEALNRRDFLKSMAVTLASSGLNPATVQSIVQTAQSVGSKPIYRLVTTALSDTLMTVDGSFRQLMSTYNMLRSIGVDRVLAGDDFGFAFNLICDITPEQFAKLSKFARVDDGSDKAGELYVKLDIKNPSYDKEQGISPNIEFVVTSAIKDPDDYKHTFDSPLDDLIEMPDVVGDLAIASPANILKIWWNQWEQPRLSGLSRSGKKLMSDNMRDFLKKNGIIDDEYNNIEIKPRSDDEIYGSSMHQPYENKLRHIEIIAESL